MCVCIFIALMTLIIGTDVFQYEMYCNAKSYMSEVQSYARPIVTKTYDSSWNMFDWHLYPGGAWRLHMLRCMLGKLNTKLVTLYVSSHV